MSDKIDERLARLAVHAPRLVVPSPGVDLYRWAVIACDQHTSEPDYWEEVDRIVGDAPSTLRLVYPEVYLGGEDAGERIASIRHEMNRYLDEDVVRELHSGFMLTVRSTPHVSGRHGLLLAIDLDQYDFRPGAKTLVRATEMTILERLPPRVRIRRDAPMELPHVLVLIDDPEDLVFGAIDRNSLDQVYSTELMLGGGRVTGYHLPSDSLDPVTEALEELVGRSKSSHPLLFAVGDGNHSLAAAREVWEEMKAEVEPDHPARYALVEVVNLYDPGLQFEPIHRLINVANRDEWLNRLCDDLGAEARECTVDEMRPALEDGCGSVGFVAGARSGLIKLGRSKELPVAIVQEYLNSRDDVSVDYIHGWDTSVQLAGKKDSLVLLMPEFNPGMLFPTVSKRGVLPRKAFSLGEAEEKRYYLEARLISR